MSSFADLVQSGAEAAEIAAHLDALDRDDRIAEVLAFPGGLMPALFDRVEGSPVKLADFVDTTGVTVIYALKNNLPLFSRSEKRFYRSPDGGVVGYNHTTGLAARFAGPGYFHVEDGDRGELRFDYTQNVELRPPGWPPLADNSGLIPGLVYGGMIDYCRAVSAHTVIGMAEKNKKPRSAFFLLTHAGEA